MSGRRPRKRLYALTRYPPPPAANTPQSQRAKQSAPLSLIDAGLQTVRNMLLRCCGSGGHFSQQHRKWLPTNLEAPSKPWESQQWRRLKTALHRHLPTDVLIDRLYTSLFLLANRASSSHLATATEPQFHLHQAVEAMDGETMFLLWWLFLDEDNTRQLVLPKYDVSPSFNLQLVTFLSEVRTHLEKLSMSYNWIVKFDYIRALSNQQHLQVLEIHSGNIDDFFVSVVAENCRLKSFQWPGKVTPAMMRTLLEGQRDCLEELNLRPLAANYTQGMSSVLQECLPSLSRLRSLTIHSSSLEEIPVLSRLKRLVLFHHDSVRQSASIKLQIFADIDAKFTNLDDFVVRNLILYRDTITLQRLFTDFSHNLLCAQRLTDLTIAINAFTDLQRIARCKSLKILFCQFRGDAEDDGDGGGGGDGVEPHWPDLRELSIECSQGSSIRYKLFKAVVGASAKLMRLSLSCGTILGFDEDDFVAHLKSRPYKRLRYVNLCVDGVASNLTMKTVSALLATAPLQHIENLIWIKRKTGDEMQSDCLSPEDESVAADAAQQLGLQPVAGSFKHGSNVWRTEDGRQFLNYFY